MQEFLKTNVGKTLIAAGYIALSAAISFVISAVADDPSLFGALTPIINVALVLVKKTFFSESTPNLGE